MQKDSWVTATADAAADDEIAALRAIVEGTAGETGAAFFQSLVQNLATAIDAQYAFVAEFAELNTRADHRVLGQRPLAGQFRVGTGRAPPARTCSAARTRDYVTPASLGETRLH